MTERRANDKTTMERFEAIERRLTEGDDLMRQLTDGISINTAAINRVDAEAIAELVAFFSAMQGAFKVLNWIGKLAMPIGAIIGMCTAGWGAWVIFKGGGRP